MHIHVHCNMHIQASEWIQTSISAFQNCPCERHKKSTVLYLCECGSVSSGHHSEWKPCHTGHTCEVSRLCDGRRGVTVLLVSWRPCHSHRGYTCVACPLDEHVCALYGHKKIRTLNEGQSFILVTTVQWVSHSLGSCVAAIMREV